MKKSYTKTLMMIAVLLLAALVLAACGGSNDDEENENDDAAYEDGYPDGESDDGETERPIGGFIDLEGFGGMGLTPVNIDDRAPRGFVVNYPFTEEFWDAWERRPMPTGSDLYFVQDFDYMIELLHDNFPFFAVAQRRFGVDVQALVWEARNVLVEGHYIIQSANDFWWVVWNYFTTPLQQIGHFAIQSHATLHLTLANVYRGGIGYDGNPLYLHGRDFSYWGEMFRDLLNSDLVWDMYGGFYIDLGNYEEGMIEPNNVTMEVLIDGEVAYIGVERFIHYNIEHDQELIFAFLREVSDFDHLIIDLRGNPGGFTRYFIQNFMMPIMYEAVEFSIYSMFVGGDRNLEWVGAHIADHYLWSGNERLVWSAEDRMSVGFFPHMNTADLGILDYISPHHVVIEPGDERLFYGKVWILVDEASASAAEIAAMYARAANFATIVGEPTRGVVGGGFVSFFSLPNTGLVVRHDIGYFIDEHGRAINEFGVIPGIRNSPDMDALETALAVIEIWGN